GDAVFAFVGVVDLEVERLPHLHREFGLGVRAVLDFVGAELRAGNDLEADDLWWQRGCGLRAGGRTGGSGGDPRGDRDRVVFAALAERDDRHQQGREDPEAREHLDDCLTGLDDRVVELCLISNLSLFVWYLDVHLITRLLVAASPVCTATANTVAGPAPSAPARRSAAGLHAVVLGRYKPAIPTWWHADGRSRAGRLSVPMTDRADPPAGALLCFDGSSDAAHAITVGGALLGSRAATVVTVWEPVAVWAPYDPAALMSAGVSRLASEDLGLDEIAEDIARETLARGVRLAGEVGFQASGKLASGKAWRAICEAAKEIDASSIVVGARGLSRVQSALLGSVSGAVVNHAGRPVLVVPVAGDPS